MRVTLRNVGLRTWGPGPGLWPDRFSLKEIGEPSPFALVHEVALASTTLVRPGATHTFLVRLLREQEPSMRPKATWWQMLLTPTRPPGGPRSDPRAFGKAARVRVPRACRRETEALAPSLEYETPQ